jgi:TP901-1 family phage major tail protein
MNGSSIAAQSGRNFLLKISDGTSPTTYVTVGGMKTNSLKLNNTAVDITNDSSNGWREYLPSGGIRSADISGSGIMDTGTAQFAAIQAAVFNQGLIEAEIVSGKGDKFFGTWAVLTFERAGTFNDAETFTITLNSHGPVVYSAA